MLDLNIITTILMSLNLSNRIFSLKLFLCGAILIPIIIVPTMVILKEKVPIVVRYRLFSLAHAIGSICISAPTSAFSIYLYKHTEIIWIPMMYFTIVVTILIISIYILDKRFYIDGYHKQ